MRLPEKRGEAVDTDEPVAGIRDARGGCTLCKAGQPKTMIWRGAGLANGVINMTRNGERDAAGPEPKARRADRRDAGSACSDRPSRTDDGEAERRRATAEDTGTEGSTQERKGDGR